MDMAPAAPGKRTEPKFAVVIRFSKSVDKAKIAKTSGATEQKKNEKTYYKSTKPNEKECFFFPTDSMMVVVPSEAQLEPAIANTGKVVISNEMQEIAKKLSKGQVWFAFSRSSIESEVKDVNQIKPALGLLGIPADAAADLVEVVKSMRGGGGYLKVDGEKLAIGLGIQCSDEKIASKAAESWSKAFKSDTDKGSIVKSLLAMVPTDLKNALEEGQKSLKAESSGTMLEMTTTVSLSNIDSFVNKTAADASKPVAPVQIRNEAQAVDQRSPRPQRRKRTSAELASMPLFARANCLRNQRPNR